MKQNKKSSSSIQKPIARLISMTSGLGDPLVISYLNCYISKVYFHESIKYSYLYIPTRTSKSAH